MDRNDPRYVSAEDKILEAAFEMLSTRDIDSIRTQDIIRRAGVHKSTFYAHYRDKYALLDSMEALAAEVLAPHLKGITVHMLGEQPDPLRLHQSYESLAEAIYSNRRLFTLVLQGHVGSITKGIAAELEKIWREAGIADPSARNISYLINATAYVITGTIEKWLQRDCTDPIDDFVGLITATGVGIRYAFEQL